VVPPDTPGCRDTPFGNHCSTQSYYSINVYRRAIQAINFGAFDKLKQFYKAYSIKVYIDVIKIAWDDLKTSTMNACWQCLLPEAVDDLKGFPTVEKETAEIVKLLKETREEGPPFNP
jgi:hypothetical protein